MKSKDAKQLAGQTRSVAEITDSCTPVVTNENLFNTTTFFGTNTLVSTNPAAPAIPCGLIAKSVFTDTFSVTDPNGTPVNIDDSNIAWESDVKWKYANTADMSQQWLNMTDRKCPSHNHARTLHCLDAHSWPS